jgi:alkanesulfonate monooxygenase SsuD/methylene tetrahydromethanopterin reductase-like flavin-dependent oxidoreductase (luciferase family)
MKLGFGLVTCQRNPADPERRSDADIYAQAVQLAKDVEAAGLASIWVSEHHFFDDGYLPSPLPLLAAMATATDRIALGTAILLAPLMDPIRLAEDAAVVDLLSRGRLVLGLGLGWRGPEFEGLGLDLRRRVARLTNAVEVLRAAWAPDGAAGDAGAVVTPKPHRPGGPPIWFGGVVEAAVRRAAAMADGFIVDPLAWSGEERERHLSTLRSAGRPIDFSAMVEVFIWDGPEDPWEMVREYQWYIDWKYRSAAEAYAPGALPAAAPPPPVDRTRPLFVGRSEQVLAGLRTLEPYLTDGGHVVARAYLPGAPWELQRTQVKLLGEIARELR